MLSSRFQRSVRSAEDVRTQVVTGNARQVLDGAAVLRIDPATAGRPLRHERRMDAQMTGESGLAACGFDSTGDGVHALTIAALWIAVNSVAGGLPTSGRIASLYA